MPTRTLTLTLKVIAVIQLVNKLSGQRFARPDEELAAALTLTLTLTLALALTLALILALALTLALTPARSSLPPSPRSSHRASRACAGWRRPTSRSRYG